MKEPESEHYDPVRAHVRAVVDDIQRQVVRRLFIDPLVAHILTGEGLETPTGFLSVPDRSTRKPLNKRRLKARAALYT